MKILSVTTLLLDSVKVVCFARDRGERGYFAVSFLRSSRNAHPESGALADVLCDPALKARFDALVANGSSTMSEKDRSGLTLSAWLANHRSHHVT